MTTASELQDRVRARLGTEIPDPVLHVFRGIGQVFFQENALTGACFVLGIALSSPLMALGAVVGSAIGTATARLLKFDEAELPPGSTASTPTLVGIATFFFFRPGAASVVAAGRRLHRGGAGDLAGAAVRAVPDLHRAVHRHDLGGLLPRAGAGCGPGRAGRAAATAVGFVGAAAHGVSQVMFQASVWTGLLFLVGIAVSDWRHAAWVLAGSVVGMLVGSYHATAAARALDPESLVDRALLENIALGLYGYNATLAAVALFLWRRSLIPPLLGILLSVPLTELFPLLGLPALTAPFVLATWLVLALGWLEEQVPPDADVAVALSKHAAARPAVPPTHVPRRTRTDSWSLAHESVAARTRQAADLRGRPGGQGPQGARPEAQRPRGDGPDHGRAAWSWPATASRSPRS